MESDEVLEKINKLFKGNIGEDYDKTKLSEIKKEGVERYDKNIPPGFKDNKKSDSKKFGDLILWYQIIDKANKIKKPIVFISGDVKEDWWLEKNGKRIMPLPQLKKEMYEKANVDFHIYTADRFLKLNETDETKIDDSAIKEVKKIRELEEKRIIMRRRELLERDRELKHRSFEEYSMKYARLVRHLEPLFMEINDSENNLECQDESDHMFRKLRYLRNKILHDEFDRKSFDRVYQHTKEILFFLERIARSGDIQPRLSMRIRNCIDLSENLIHAMRRFV